ncbi:UNVERIFIED_CONTAM: hypothetical protein PYX00_006595 [Menopon gallinae]|uniref:Uncharacterized protein n=1 Tax=Menopon gallinae TaxID=328185 RepID=A0AAW2HVW8_9NEOP
MSTLSGRGYAGSGAPPLRHSVSFSCLPRGAIRDRPHRARTATLPSDTDYGFVRAPPAVRLSVKYGVVVEEESSDGQHRIPVKKESFRDNIVKKSVSILSPNAWWSNKPRRTRNKDVIVEEEAAEDSVQQRRWRSLGALLRLPNQNPSAQPPSPRAQSFYLLDDFLPRPSNSRREHSGTTTSSSDSLELSSPLPPPVPPPPPPLRLLGYRDCSCRHCRQVPSAGEDRTSSNNTVFILFFISW